MIDNLIIQGMMDDPVGCVVALPGRAILGSFMGKFLFHTGLCRSLQIIFEPQRLQWYPQPNGPDDQSNALRGLGRSVVALERAIKKIEKGWGVPKSKIGIVGFSAGAVMAIQLLANSDEPYAGILSLSGAILDPESLPEAKYDTPVLLQHNMDDDCFKWDERYLPMKQSLRDKNYNVSFRESAVGGHSLTYAEVHLCRSFMSKVFGYSDFFEESEERLDD